MSSKAIDTKEKVAMFGRTINDVHQVILQENADVIKPFSVNKNVHSYEQAVKSPPKVNYAGMTFRPKGELMYRGSSYVEVDIDPKSMAYEITQGKQSVEYGDLFVLKGLKLDDAFGFAISEAIKRVFRGKQIYDIRLNMQFKVCYSLEINKNRAFFGVTLADEDPLNDKLSMDERMFIELAFNLVYGFFAQINKIENPLSESEIRKIQEEYAAINQNFIENNSPTALSGEWDKVRQYDVITRNTEDGLIIDYEKFDNGVAARGSSSVYNSLLERVNAFKNKLKG